MTNGIYKAQEAYFKKLNRSFDRHAMWRRWSTYRKSVTDKVIGTIGEGESLGIIGAGLCLDVDLQRLSAKAGSIKLLDIDEEAMAWGVAFQKTGRNIEIMKTDVLGLDFLPVSERSLTGVTAYLEKMVAELPVVENLLVLPIYSQLHLFHWFGGTAPDAPDVLLATQEAIDCLNRQLAAWMDKDYAKSLTVMVDIIEDDGTGLFTKTFNNGTDFEMLAADYEKTYGPGLGSYGIETLKEHLSAADPQLEIVSGDWIQWPFSHNRILFVKNFTFRCF